MKATIASCDDERASEPVVVAAEVEHDLERADARTSRPRPTVSTGTFCVFDSAPRSSRNRGERAQNRDRHVDEEDPVPAPIVADRAAEDRAEDRRDDRGHRPQAHGHAVLFLGEDAQQQRLA